MGVGFDVLGHAMVSVGDRVTVRRTEEPRVVIRSESASMPLDPASNTAGAGLLRLIEEMELEFGFEVELEKGIPLGSGMGGSAASAAGAILAASHLLPRPLDEAGLLRYGMYGEAVATGAFHPDNLAPCLLGGLVLALEGEPLRVVRIPVPPLLHCVVVHPRLRVDTRDARAVLPQQIALKEHVAQSGRLAGVIAGCYSDDLELIGRTLEGLYDDPPLVDPRPTLHTAQEMFDLRLMFHGPGFQGIPAMGPIGDDGMLGTFDNLATPGSLLDNLGKLIAYWAIDFGGVGEAALPSGVARVEWFGPKPAPGVEVRCDIRMVEQQRDLVRADGVLILPDGSILARVAGWTSILFHLDELMEPLHHDPGHNDVAEAQQALRSMSDVFGLRLQPNGSGPDPAVVRWGDFIPNFS